MHNSNSIGSFGEVFEVYEPYQVSNQISQGVVSITPSTSQHMPSTSINRLPIHFPPISTKTNYALQAPASAVHHVVFGTQLPPLSTIFFQLPPLLPVSPTKKRSHSQMENSSLRELRPKPFQREHERQDQMPFNLPGKRNNDQPIIFHYATDTDELLGEKVFKKKPLREETPIINSNTKIQKFRGTHKGWAAKEQFYLLKKMRNLQNNVRDWNVITEKLNNKFKISRNPIHCYAHFKNLWEKILPPSFYFGGEVCVKIYKKEIKVFTKNSDAEQWEIYREYKYTTRNLEPSLVPPQSSLLRDEEESETPEIFSSSRSRAVRDHATISLEKESSSREIIQTETADKCYESPITFPWENLQYELYFPATSSCRSSFKDFTNINVVKLKGTPISIWTKEEINFLLTQVRETEGDTLNWLQITENFNKHFKSKRSSKSCYSRYSNFKKFLPDSFYCGGEVCLQVFSRKIKTFVADQNGQLILVKENKFFFKNK